MPLVTDPDNLGYYLAAGATAPASYTTGTVTTTGSNNTVTGSGTTWTAAMVGRTITFGAASYVVATWVSATSITVTSTSVKGSSVNPPAQSGVAYSIDANVTIDTTGKLIYVRQGGMVSTSGVTLKALYSKLKDIWQGNSNAQAFTFPMTPITDEQMIFGSTDAWKPGDDTSRQLIRTGGWAEQTSGVSNREYAGVITLGSLLGTEQVYFAQVSGTTATTTNFVLTGAVNQAVQVYGDASNGNFDYRGYLQLYVRTQARNYASAGLTDIGVTTMTYQVYRFPLASSVDTNVTDSDVTVSGFGITATWYASAQSISIGGTNYNFSIIINGNSKTKTQIYEAMQYLLRQAGDIDSGAGVQDGVLVSQFGTLVGGTLTTQLVGGKGVYISNFQAGDTNSLVFTDDTGTTRTFPYTASLSLSFGANLVADSNAIYRVYFTTNPGGNFDTANAILVNDASASPMSGTVGGLSSIQRTFAYDTNNQGGRTAGTDAAITAVAIGLSGAQYVLATGTITRSTANAVSLVSSLERNYLNP